jgi:hypothetical protein
MIWWVRLSAIGSGGTWSGKAEFWRPIATADGAKPACFCCKPKRLGFAGCAMGSWKKTLEKVQVGNADASIRYDELCHLPTRLGYGSNQTGSHRVFRLAGRDIINLQRAGAMAKSYQVRQVRDQLAKFKK